jgi:hypothetical protein
MNDFLEKAVRCLIQCIVAAPAFTFRGTPFSVALFKPFDKRPTQVTDVFTYLYTRRPLAYAVKVCKVSPTDDSAQQAFNVFTWNDWWENAEELVIMTNFFILNI